MVSDSEGMKFWHIKRGIPPRFARQQQCRTGCQGNVAPDATGSSGLISSRTFWVGVTKGRFPYFNIPELSLRTREWIYKSCIFPEDCELLFRFFAADIEPSWLINAFSVGDKHIQMYKASWFQLSTFDIVFIRKFEFGSAMHGRYRWASNHVAHLVCYGYIYVHSSLGRAFFSVNTVHPEELCVHQRQQQLQNICKW